MEENLLSLRTKSPAIQHLCQHLEDLQTSLGIAMYQLEIDKKDVAMLEKAIARQEQNIAGVQSAIDVLRQVEPFRFKEFPAEVEDAKLGEWSILD